jgi:aminoglycoside phosphotransferase (APT) family kinase protein
VVVPPTEPSGGALDRAAPAELLTPNSVLPYLAARGLVGPVASAAELSGGVSNVVLRIRDGSTDLIVKQSLPRLRVAEEWLAPQERTITEAEAMVLAATVVDDGVPRIILTDDTAFVLAMQSAPDDWTDWKTQLMAGQVSEHVAARVGAIVGKVHRATLDTSSLSPLLCATEPFEQLRLRPYYEHTALVKPEWGVVLGELADELRANRRCLVHGDLSPKNILAPPDVASGRAWVIDFEVAHRGDPRFDLAFLLTHLTMKAVHLPGYARALDRAAHAFMDSYAVAAGPELTPEVAGTLRHVGALLLARVHGKSPAEYLTPQGSAHVERLATLALEGRIVRLDDLFRSREDSRS